MPAGALVAGADVVPVPPAAPHAARTAAAARVKMMRRMVRTSRVVMEGVRRRVTFPARYSRTMCRSIKTLRGAEPPADDDDAHAAALQFVRKISGYRAPSKANQLAFDSAVQEVTAATTRLLEGLQQRA